MYQIGMRLYFRVTDPRYSYLSHTNGEVGTIVAIEDNFLSIGVCFDKENRWYHSLAGRCEPGHGFWFSADELDKVSINLFDLAPIKIEPEVMYKVKNPAIYTKIKTMREKRKALGYAY